MTNVGIQGIPFLQIAWDIVSGIFYSRCWIFQPAMLDFGKFLFLKIAKHHLGVFRVAHVSSPSHLLLMS